MPKLTKRVVESAKPESLEYVVWDEDLAGFGLRVKATGVRSYFVQYRNAAGRSRRVTLGKHGVLAADRARRLAQDALAAVREGRDPAEERASERTAPTMTEFAERYIAEHALPKKKPSSLRNDRRYLDRHILPALGRRKVAEITRADVQKLHNKLRATPYEANRVLAALSKMFNLAERWGVRPDHSNPCRHVEKFREARRERFLSPAEIGRLGQVLAEVEREKSTLPSVVPLIRLLLVTGARLDEMLRLRWEYIDGDSGFIRLPDSKTGAKVLPITPLIREVLGGIERDPDSPWVIAGREPRTHLVNASKPWGRIRARAGLDGVRIHDLRHTYASYGAARGYGLPIIGSLLGHREAATTKRYAHLANDPMKQAAADISAAIGAALRSAEGAPVATLHRHER